MYYNNKRVCIYTASFDVSRAPVLYLERRLAPLLGHGPIEPPNFPVTPGQTRLRKVQHVRPLSNVCKDGMQTKQKRGKQEPQTTKATTKRVAMGHHCATRLREAGGEGREKVAGEIVAEAVRAECSVG